MTQISIHLFSRSDIYETEPDGRRNQLRLLPAEENHIFRSRNEIRKGYGVGVIPFYSVGRNPSPRIDNIVPWIQYPDVPYAPLATEEELLSGAEKLVNWMKENPDTQKSGHIMTFAWNEFEEGGHICPTYGTDGAVDLSRLSAFQKVVTYWKENL